MENQLDSWMLLVCRGKSQIIICINTDGVLIKQSFHIWRV